MSASPSFIRRGFTLIEVMVVVAIVAVLAAVALPAYFDSVRKSRRADAYNELSRAQQMQERFRVINPRYGEGFNSGAAPSAVVAAASTASFTSSGGYYNIAIAPATAASNVAYGLRASPVSSTSSQAKDTNCQCLSLAASAGQITYGTGTWSSGACSWSTIITGGTADRCWRR